MSLLMQLTLETTTSTQIEDSLKKRYLYKLSTNLVGFLISLVTATIIPRGLGPAAYGSFDFLSTFFTQVIGFFESGTTLAFYTKLSQRPHEGGLLRFYWGFTGILSLVLFLFVAAVFMVGLADWLWPEQQTLYIWLAAIMGLLILFSDIINRIVDAYGLTVTSETIRIYQKILGLGLILGMLWLNWFSLTGFFLYNYLLLLFLCLAWWQVLKQNRLTLLPGVKLSNQEIKGYSQEFYDYSAPLVTFAFVALLANVLDRWLLQKFAGSIEQGFYGLSYKIGAICFLFTSAMTPLLTREFAKAYGEKDLAHMSLLYQRYIPMLYTIAAFFAVFMAVQADKVSLIFGGSQFQGATLAIAIMAFYPIHQTYGQLSGSVFYATGRTRLYRNIGILTLLVGLPVTFWLIAPAEWYGLNLGATGLAIKMVVIQLLGVQLDIWFNTRWLQLSFWKLLAHQIFVVVGLGVVAWLASMGVDGFIQATLPAFLVSGIIYTLGAGIILFLWPSMLFMSRAELRQQLAQAKLKLGE